MLTPVTVPIAGINFDFSFTFDTAGVCRLKSFLPMEALLMLPDNFGICRLNLFFSSPNPELYERLMSATYADTVLFLQSLEPFRGCNEVRGSAFGTRTAEGDFLPEYRDLIPKINRARLTVGLAPIWS
jgi:hypothetical protein